MGIVLSRSKQVLSAKCRILGSVLAGYLSGYSSLAKYTTPATDRTLEPCKRPQVERRERRASAVDTKHAVEREDRSKVVSLTDMEQTR